MTLLEPTQIPARHAPLTIRRAAASDAAALARLAALDSSRAPRGDILLAEVAGELWAAVSLENFHAVADPFRPSGELAFVLIKHARRLRRAERDRRGFMRSIP